MFIVQFQYPSMPATSLSQVQSSQPLIHHILHPFTPPSSTLPKGNPIKPSEQFLHAHCTYCPIRPPRESVRSKYRSPKKIRQFTQCISSGWRLTYATTTISADCVTSAAVGGAAVILSQGLTLNNFASGDWLCGSEGGEVGCSGDGHEKEVEELHGEEVACAELYLLEVGF